MLYPTVNEPETTRDMLTTFAGYNHNTVINDGEWYDCQNLTTDNYPVLSVRERTSVLYNIQNEAGMCVRNGKLYYLDDEGYLCEDSIQTSLLVGFDTYDEFTHRQFVSMGAFIVIFPDKKYYNTADPTDYGNLEKTYSNTGFNIRKSKVDGETFPSVTYSSEEPSSPTDGQLWCDTTSEPFVYKKYYSSMSSWLTYTDHYIRIGSTGIGSSFDVGDGVSISGFKGMEQDSSSLNFKTTREQLDSIDGYHTIVAKGDNYIVIAGEMYGTASFTGKVVSVNRDVPALDYVCESQNRLWGCHYGVVDGKLVNELYCSKLGDFKNWYTYQGISTDSWAASCGTDGKWTGCITCNGYPTFFKENYIHKIYISSTGGHQVVTTEARGVEDGSSKSLTICNEVLYYKSADGIMAYTGSAPSCISREFGFEKYHSVVAGSYKDKVYISANTIEESSINFVYDSSRGIWHKENVNKAVNYAVYQDNIIWLSYGGKIYRYGGVESDEPNLSWYAETGDIGLDSPDNKYVSRFNIRLNLELGASVEIFIEYDSSGLWTPRGTVFSAGMRSVTIPVPPIRCDHCRIKLVGKGRCKLYSISKVWEQGSDV